MAISTAPEAPFTIRPEIITRLRELRGEHRVAVVSLYDTASQAAVHAVVRHDDAILSVAISSPTPQDQARREHVALAQYAPDGCGTVFHVIPVPGAN